MDLTPKKHAGAKNELIATVWLLQQGYEVFRNVSQHGDVDIIATKDSETLYIDVKASVYNVKGQMATSGIRLTQRQIDLGVRRLNVYWDGKCTLVAKDSVSALVKIACAKCTKMFSPQKMGQTFCGKQCRPRESTYVKKGYPAKRPWLRKPKRSVYDT